MGYNDPIGEPQKCDCGAQPTVYSVGHDGFVQCDECGLTGPVVWQCGAAVLMWNTKLGRQVAPDDKRVSKIQETFNHEVRPDR